MGMSASQARMLTLTARLSDLEYSAQSISNTKIRLADQTEDAATAYSNALDLQKLTAYDSDTDSYVDTTAYNLTTYNAISELAAQRILTNNAGQIGVSQAIADAFEASADPNDTTTTSYALRSQYGADGYEDMLTKLVANYPDGDFDEAWVTYYSDMWNGAEDFLYELDPKGTSCPDGYVDAASGKEVEYDKARSTYYRNIFIEMQDNGYFVIEGNKMNDSDWLYAQLNNGSMYIKNWDNEGSDQGTGAFVEVPWTSGDTGLNLVDDDDAIAKAEAVYDTQMALIETKETKLDLQLKRIDTEHSAIQTEIDSVKKVIDKNIDRTFKMFDA